ncbi:MAG: MBL fold metallo-hydrolase, partial [Dehalococcoidia bacterium]
MPELIPDAAAPDTATPDTTAASPLPPQEIVAPTGAHGAGGLYRLRTPMTSTALPWIMPYAFLGAEGVTLFDSGYGTPEATTALTQQLAAIGRTPSDIQRLVISHAHPDHIGMASWVKQQAPDADLVMYRVEGEAYARMHHAHERWETSMRSWGVRHGFDPDAVERDHRPGWAREQERRREAEATGKSTDAAAETERRSWGMERVTPDVLLEDGEELAFDGFTLRAVWTPG